jgi:ribonuclease HI
MSVPAPHFLLFSEAAQPAGAAAGQWRFVLKPPRGDPSLEVADDEHAAGLERLELLAIVRGLEALDQPSKVTLMTGSRDIQRGLQFGLNHWREHDWQWERYGQMTPVKNADLWKRIDRLLEIHNVACRPRRLESVDDLAAPIGERTRTDRKRGRHGKRLRIDRPVAPSDAQRAPRGGGRDSTCFGEGRARRLHQGNVLTAMSRRLIEFLFGMFRSSCVAGE